MNFIAIGLHCLDMRDFHSHMRETPFLDELRKKCVFIPMGRAQGHNQQDSLNAEMTGLWTPRFGDSELTREGFKYARESRLTKTLLERVSEAGYQLFTYIGQASAQGFFHRQYGSFAVEGGMKSIWLRDEPERLAQFNAPEAMTADDLLRRIAACTGKFYAHFMLRDTHRPWGQKEGLCALAGMPPSRYPDDALCARKAALERPDEFAALRRRGLSRADQIVARIFEATKHIEDVTYIVYSNHGEVFDHFRYHLINRVNPDGMIVGTSHGNYPYEALYANMQMWLIPGHQAKVVGGVGRSIDFAPTVLELADIEHPLLDGESMVASFADGRFPHRERIAEGSGCVSLVRSDGYKFLSTGMVEDDATKGETFGPEHHRLAVFELASDPREYVNLIDTKQGQRVLDWAIDRHQALKS